MRRSPLESFVTSPGRCVVAMEACRGARHLGRVFAAPDTRSAGCRRNMCARMVRLEGAYHLWRKIPPRELSIDLEADERLGRAIGRAGAS